MNRTFCLYCKVFAFSQPKFSLASVRNCNGKNLHKYQRTHESLPEHLRSYFQRLDVCKRLNSGNTVDQEVGRNITYSYSKTRFFEPCKMVYRASQCTCPKRSLAFQGKNCKERIPNNGNLIRVEHLLIKYGLRSVDMYGVLF